MNHRFLEMKKLLDEGCYFKLVCGAGNENSEEVRKLTLLYTLAGANGFDVSAKPEIVRSAVAGIEAAYAWAQTLRIQIPTRPFITVSVGMPGDHHVRKAYIIESCVRCHKCISVCPTQAIPETLKVIRNQCIGCGACEEACPKRVNAIRYEHDEKILHDILPKCLEAGAENIELHAAVPSNEQIMDEWKTVCEIQPNHYVSMCVDRQHLSTQALIERIRDAHAIAGDRLLVQADGVPMSGTQDGFNTTLQAIATTDIIRKHFKQLPLLVSGGTNSHSGKLARLCAVHYNGLSIGTFARKIVKQNLDRQNFDSDEPNMKAALIIAKALVQTGKQDAND